VHPRYDVRIFLKQCVSLANAGWQTTLIVADGKGDEFVSGVSILDVGKPGGRLARMVSAPRRMLARAETLSADVFHFHDPELLPVGMRLKRLGRRVVFDSHEDVPKDILSKEYLNPVTRQVVSRLYASFERWGGSKFDAVVAATPSIRDHCARFNARVVDINNYPLSAEIAEGPTAQRAVEICYVGGISAARGVVEVVEAMALVRSGVRLQLIGEFLSEADGRRVSSSPGWGHVDAHGHLERSQAQAFMRRSLAGVLTYHPEPNHVAAQPNKLFEYMAAGIAVIVSDFPLWRQIVERFDCGICVDPQDPRAIAEAIDLLASDPDRAIAMGANGRQAILSSLNWDAEERKLLALYDEIAP